MLFRGRARPSGKGCLREDGVKDMLGCCFSGRLQVLEGGHVRGWVQGCEAQIVETESVWEKIVIVLRVICGWER